MENMHTNDRCKGLTGMKLETMIYEDLDQSKIIHVRAKESS